ncbi:dihydrodipicolinate reductase [Paraburkholderia youngii]
MKIAIAGASGRMGRMLIETVLNDADTTLSGALCRTGAAQLGQDAGARSSAKRPVCCCPTISSACLPNPTT